METIKLKYYEKVGNKIKEKEFQLDKQLLKNKYSKQSLFISRVEGNSMEPIIKDKSLVIADLSQKNFEENNIFLISKNEKMWIKKAIVKKNKKFFISCNSKFRHLKYEINDCRIIAKVLLYFNNL